MNNFLKNYKIDMTKKDKWITFGVAIGLILLLTIVPICVTLCALAYPKKVLAYEYPAVTKVGYETEYLDQAKRVKPVDGMSDEGLISNGTVSAYPRYGSTLREVIGGGEAQVAARNALISESWKLCTVNTRIGTDGFPKNTYNSMGEDGKLYLNGVDTGRTLYKHTASVGMYLGDVDDDEPGVVKRITMSPTRGYTNRGYNVTGLYAAPGEVVKVEISDADMDATNGITVHVGQALYNAKANNIWTAKNAMNRMPVILNTWVINKTTAQHDEERGVWTAYVGSFLGGPIYVVNESVKFSVTISGAVKYSHFILGYTTPEEFEENAKSSAPYFDLEVFYNGVLHSGPKAYAKNFSYDQLYKAAVLWEKVSLVANSNGDRQGYNQGIVFLYDPFVAAGAAVAFPGQGSVNCPMGWMASSLNYDSVVTSGSWGNFHEYHHNFQNYGVGYTGEVTNNGLNLVAYSLFTKISAARQMGGYGGAGLSGWNQYTSATWALQRVNLGGSNINSTNGLAVYATLLHNFGQEAFLSARGSTGVNYLNRWATITHQDFSYFDSMITGYTGGKLNPTATDYPTFVPVSSVYQTGRSYMYDNEKRYIETMQPYQITYGQNFTVDLNKYTVENGQYVSGSIVIPDGFDFKIKKVTQPANGKIRNNGDNTYTFTPNKNTLSGKIYVTLEITCTDENLKATYGIDKIDDVELVLEFEQNHEMNKSIVQRTTYTYDASKMYSDPTIAFENHYAGYSSTTGMVDNDNYMESLNRVVQDANSEIWNLHEAEVGKTVMELSGKLYVATDGDYRIALRGREYAALYLSFDGGKNYELAVNMANTQLVANNKASPYFLDGNWKDYENLKAGQWIYYKAVLLITKSDNFVGVGWGQLIEPMITNQLIDPEDESKGSQMVYGGVAQTITLADGTTKTIRPNTVITDEEAALLKPTVTLAYASSYRSDYEFTHAFESDYFILPNYSATDKIEYDNKGSLVEVKGYTQADGEQYNIGVLFDEDDTNFIHNATYNITAENPFDITVDLGEVITTNSMTIYGESTRAYQPRSFVLYGGTSLNNMKQIAVVESATRIGYNVVVNFDRQALRYYRLVVTDTFARGVKAYAYIAYRYIKFSYSLADAKVLSPDDEMFTYRGKWQIENRLSTFGHIFSGKNTQVQFTFTGTQFAVYSFQSLDFDKFEVCIDGVTMPAVSICNDTNATALAYLSPILKDKKHTVVVRSKSNFNIDSFAIWG